MSSNKEYTIFPTVQKAVYLDILKQHPGLLEFIATTMHVVADSPAVKEPVSMYEFRATRSVGTQTEVYPVVQTQATQANSELETKEMHSDDTEDRNDTPEPATAPSIKLHEEHTRFSSGYHLPGSPPLSTPRRPCPKVTSNELQSGTSSSTRSCSYLQFTPQASTSSTVSTSSDTPMTPPDDPAPLGPCWSCHGIFYYRCGKMEVSWNKCSYCARKRNHRIPAEEPGCKPHIAKEDYTSRFSRR